MAAALPQLFLARHGDTAWTDSHQHTGRTDIPLNERGEEHARQMGVRLRGFSFVQVLTSPLQRASKTCELAGFGGVAEVDPHLTEWAYRDLEGDCLPATSSSVGSAGTSSVMAASAVNHPKTLLCEPTASSRRYTFAAVGQVLASYLPTERMRFGIAPPRVPLKATLIEQTEDQAAIARALEGAHERRAKI